MKFACTTLLLLAPTAATATTTWAQDDAASAMAMSAPSAQLDRLSGIIGEFEGGGTLAIAPGAQPMEWTATATGKRVLGGHFVQVDETIQAPFGAMSFRSLYAWDAATERLVGYWIEPTKIGRGDLFWPDDKTLVTVNHGTAEGQPYSERSTTTFSSEGYSFSMDRMVGSAPAFTMVAGKMKRVQTASTAAIEAAASTTEPNDPSEQMTALAPMIGKWNMTGNINMMGMKMDITAVEQVDWFMDSSVIAGHVDGQPGGYESDWYLAYDVEAGVYRHMGASNMGEIGMSTGHLMGDQVIFTEESVRMGQPTVSRLVMQFADGGISSVWSDTITGAGDPVRSFQASYSRALAYSAGSCCAKAEAAGATCTHPCCITAAEKGEVCARCNQ